MALRSGFKNEARFADIPGCPLGPTGEPRDESACAACPYNALSPGAARVGCMMSTPMAVYERSLAHLQRISRADHAALLSLLARGREEGLDRESLAAVRDIAARWLELVGNDLDEKRLVLGALRFASAGLAMSEPMAVLE